MDLAYRSDIAVFRVLWIEYFKSKLEFKGRLPRPEFLFLTVIDVVLISFLKKNLYEKKTMKTLWISRRYIYQ